MCYSGPRSPFPGVWQPRDKGPVLCLGIWGLEILHSQHPLVLPSLSAQLGKKDASRDTEVWCPKGSERSQEGNLSAAAALREKDVRARCEKQRWSVGWP